MNLHSIFDIDKSFKLCYLKKKQNLFSNRVFIMIRVFFCSVSAIMIFSACRSRDLRDVPEVTPLPRENVRISMDVNISDTAAGASQVNTAAPAPPPEKVQKVQPRTQDQLIVSKKEKDRRKRAAKQARKRKEFVPDVTGLIDGELNSVERSYVQDVRLRREQQVQKSEQQVFGSFKPEGIFRSSAE